MPEDDDEQPQLPLAGVGPRLKEAREKAGISRSEIAGKTRISERVIAHMEEGNFAALPSRTYAIGFTRTYARAVGLDDNVMVEALRRELGYAPPIDTAGDSDSYEPGDPARVPSARVAWWVAIVTLVLVAAGLYVWRTWYAPSATLPSILDTPEPTIEPTFTTEAIVPSSAASFDINTAPNPAFTFAPQVSPPRQHPRERPHASSTPSSDSSPSGGSPAASPSPATSPQTSTVSN